MAYLVASTERIPADVARPPADRRRKVALRVAKDCREIERQAGTEIEAEAGAGLESERHGAGFREFLIDTDPGGHGVRAAVEGNPADTDADAEERHERAATGVDVEPQVGHPRRNHF